MRYLRLLFPTVVTVALFFTNSLGAEPTLHESARLQDLVASLKEICKLAAQKEYAGLTSGEPTQVGLRGVESIGGSEFASARKLYFAALQLALAAEAESGNDEKVQRVLSEVYSRIGWFQYETARGEKQQQGKELIKRAIALDPKNAIALYKEVLLLPPSKGTDNDATIQKLKKIVELRPQFPEAWLDLCSAYLRAGKNEEADKAREQFTQNREHFTSELYLFDNGYPHKGQTIRLPSGDLERKEFQGDSRFETIPNL